MSSPKSIRIVEVGPRDGLQNVAATVPTATKLQLIERLRATGLDTIELTSVVSPKAIPQLADCQKVLENPAIKHLIANRQLRLPVLVPNNKGLDIAIKHGVKEVAVFVSASEGFSKANINCSVQEGIDRAGKVATAALKAGVVVRGYISCIFADPYDGPVPPSAVLSAAQKLLDMGCYEISLGDTLGVGTPSDVRKLLNFLFDNGIPVEKLAGHFHDTYGQAVGNAWTAYQCGLRVFDSSVGGLGGCPFAPGARGNVSTEDIVYMFEQAGISTGVNLEQLAAVGVWISTQLGKSNDSRAGSAIAAKSKAKQSNNSVSSTPQAKEPPRISWKLDQHADGLDIYRAGVNVKVVLNRPANGNALTIPMIEQLTDFFHRAASDKSISRIVTTARGKFFCTGMDLGKSTSVSKGSSASDEQYERLTRLFDLIAQAPQVTIACINGSCFGGGVGLAFACDVRIALESARLTLSEVKLGLAPATISKYVVREWGFAFTREAMLSARPISVNELLALGLIAQVAKDAKALEKALDAYLERLKHCAPNASKLSKQLVACAWKDDGGREQQQVIRRVFGEMMKQGGESAWGVKQFQQGNKQVDWDAYVRSQGKAKL